MTLLFDSMSCCPASVRKPESLMMNSERKHLPLCLVCAHRGDSPWDLDDLKYPLGYSENPDFGGQNEILLMEAFQTFNHYLNQNHPAVNERYEFNFTSDPFPFCRRCSKSLFQLNDFHQEVEGLLKQIRDIVTVLLTDIITSWGPSDKIQSYQQDCNSQGIEVDDESKCGSHSYTNESSSETFPAVFPVEKIRYYRNCIYSNYNPEVSLSREDRRACLSNPLKRSCSVRIQKSNRQRQPKRKYLPEADYEIEKVDSDPENGPDNMQATVDIDLSEEEFCNSDMVQSCLVQSLADDERPSRRQLQLNSYNNRVVQTGLNLYVFDSKRSFEWMDNAVWRCLQCGFKSRRRFGFLQHFNRSVCSGKPAKDALKECKFQDFVYDQLQDFRFECRLCAFQVDSEYLMKKHLVERHLARRLRKKRTELKKLEKDRRKDSNGRFRCDLCPATFLTYRIAMQHIKTRHSEKHGNHICEICGRACSTQYTLTLHQKRQHGAVEKSFKCDHCKSAFITPGDLRRHSVVHGEKKFMCETCGAAFTTMKNLNSHSRAHTTVVCEICGESKTSTTIKSHYMLSHSGTELKGCDTCDRKFVHSSSLKYHKMACGGHQPFACDLCDKRYTCISTLNKHKNLIHKVTRTGEVYVPPPKTTSKTFPCEKCGKEYLHQSSLCHHKKSCGGVKPYSCDICNKKFKCRFSVKKHKENKHGIKVSGEKSDTSDLNPDLASSSTEMVQNDY